MGSAVCIGRQVAICAYVVGGGAVVIGTRFGIVSGNGSGGGGFAWEGGSN